VKTVLIQCPDSLRRCCRAPGHGPGGLGPRSAPGEDIGVNTIPGITKEVGIDETPKRNRCERHPDIAEIGWCRRRDDIGVNASLALPKQVGVDETSG
jgi:hypothetical protein